MDQVSFVVNGLPPKTQRIRDSLLNLFREEALAHGVVAPVNDEQSEAWLKWVVPEIERAYGTHIYSGQAECLTRARDEICRICAMFATNPNGILEHVDTGPAPDSPQLETPQTTQTVFVEDGPLGRDRTIRDKLLDLFREEALTHGVEAPIGNGLTARWLRWVVPEIEKAYGVRPYSLEDERLRRAEVAITRALAEFGVGPAGVIEYIRRGHRS